MDQVDAIREYEAQAALARQAQNAWTPTVPVRPEIPTHGHTLALCAFFLEVRERFRLRWPDGSR